MRARLAPWIAAPDDGQQLRVAGRAVPGWARVAVSTLVLLVVFTGLRMFATSACRLPEAGYASASILQACAIHRGALIPGAGLYLLLLLLVPPLRQGWHALEGGGSLRWLVGGVTLALAWAGAGYQYNPWYDQPHVLDRAVLWALAALVVWRPAFVLPFAVVFWALIWQFDFPALGFRVLVADFRPAVHVLIAFAAVFLIQGVWRHPAMHAFLFLALCLVAANYWVPAYAKLQIGWLSHGHLYFLLPNAYTHGWLAWLDPDTIARAARLLAAADWPMRIGTLLVEAGALFLLAGPRVARAVLAAVTVLLGLFFLTIGYFFWKWMLLQVLLWLVVFRAPEAAVWRQRLFTPARFAVSVVLIASASWWCAPAALAWYDTPVTSTLRFEAVGASGAAYDLPPAFFAPYESHIAMGTFIGALTPEPILAGSYGVTSVRARADALLRTSTVDEVRELEMKSAGGAPANRDEALMQTLDAFVRRAVLVSNRRRTQAIGWLHPPPFLVTFAHGRAYRGEEPIEAVRIYHVSSFFDGQVYRVFRRQLIRTVPATGGYE